ncbi:MAG: phage holin family protein [Thermoanaerobaculia bacterium]
MAGRGWMAMLRALGRSTVELYAAEVRALADDLGRSAGQFLRALVLVGVVFALFFWILGLFIYLAVELLALWLPRAGAVGIVLGIFVAAALATLGAARSRFAAIEAPADTVRRRLDEHGRWWRQRVIVEIEELEEEEP